MSILLYTVGQRTCGQSNHQSDTTCQLLMQLHNHQAFSDKDLHVFVKDSDQVEQSIKTFKELYSTRTRKSREFWLVDISEWTNKDSENELNNQIRSDFVDMPLDLDDDLYFFSGKSLDLFFLHCFKSKSSFYLFGSTQ